MNGVVGRASATRCWVTVHTAGETSIIPGLCFPAPWRSLIARYSTERCRTGVSIVPLLKVVIVAVAHYDCGTA